MCSYQLQQFWLSEYMFFFKCNEDKENLQNKCNPYKSKCVEIKLNINLIMIMEMLLEVLSLNISKVLILIGSWDILEMRLNVSWCSLRKSLLQAQVNLPTNAHSSQKQPNISCKVFKVKANLVKYLKKKCQSEPYQQFSFKYFVK